MVRSIGFALAVCVVLATAMPARADSRDTSDIGAEAPGEEDDTLYRCAKARNAKVQVTLKPDTELKDLVEWAMTFTCKNFIYSSKIGGRSPKITLVAPGRMSPQDAWRAFLVALQSAGLTVVPKGNLLEIVESAQAKGAPLPVYAPNKVTDTDQIVRMVLRPEHVGVDDLAAVLTAIKSTHGEVTALPKAGILVITDYGSSIDRMLDVTAQIDQPLARDHVYIVPLEHAESDVVAAKLAEVFKSTEPAAPAPAKRATRRGTTAATSVAGASDTSTAVPTQLVSEPRTNVLIVVGSDAAYRRVVALVKYLDLPLPGGDGGMYVYHLKNADATTLAQTLTASLGGGAPQAAGGRQARTTAPSNATGGAMFEGAIRVTADAESNALVIVATVKDFAALRDVIGELDQPRRQVFIEAHIIEYQVDNGTEVGGSFHVGDVITGGRADGSFALGGVNHEGLNSAVPQTAAQTGGVAGLLGPLIPGANEFLGISIPSFGVLFHALATRGHVEILSQPHLTATDNKEAKISVGQNIAVQTGTTGASTDATGSPFVVPTQPVQRQRVGLELTITPHISDDTIRLEVQQEISDIAPGSDPSLTPSWTERKVSTTVVVHNQEPIVIGGIMQRRSSETHSKVPLLGDLPVLGHFFRNTKTTMQKTNLLIIMTPYLIESEADLRGILDRKRAEQREFLGTLTMFDDLRFAPHVDYSRRRGLLDEINRSVMRVERERAVLEEFEIKKPVYPDGPIDAEVTAVTE